MDELLDKLQSGKDYSLIYLRNAARGVNVNYLGAVTPDYEGGKIYALFNGYPLCIFELNKDAYMQKREEKENEIHRPYQKYVR